MIYTYRSLTSDGALYTLLKRTKTLFKNNNRLPSPPRLSPTLVVENIPAQSIAPRNRNRGPWTYSRAQTESTNSF